MEKTLRKFFNGILNLFFNYSQFNNDFNFKEH